MAIAPTGAMYKALKFDGVSSRTYGVYITGEAVYNAPERDVEMITIPGRNGSFALDNGRFQNIEVSYPAGIFADTEADFRQAVSDFRNFLCSRKGYVRLQDEYNPDEYRMAVYKSGLEVDPAMLKAGEFTITFDCKPQRWLTSGETKQTIASSGDTVSNSTLFESSPLLEVKGYGTIEFNGFTIERNTDPIGNIQVLGSDNWYVFGTNNFTLDLSNLNTGDSITVSGVNAFVRYKTNIKIMGSSITATSNAAANTTFSSGYANFDITCDDIAFTKGTSGFATCTAGISITSANSTYDRTGTMQIVVSYDGTNTLTITGTMPTFADYKGTGSGTLPAVIGDSTKTTTSETTYIDCYLGEAYYISGGEVISLNAAVELPATLPTLASGSNTITYDNTITSFKITPRWWKV